MAEAVGALRVSLGLDSAQFQDGLKNASGSMEGFATRAVAIGTIIGNGISSALEKVGHSIANAFEGADKMGKMAQSVGVPVEELSKLSLAAKLSDVSLDSLATSLGKFSKNMAAAAANPTSQTARAFDALGVSVRNTDGSMKSSSSMLSEVATKFAGYEDGVNKTALAMALFGKAGAAMIPMLNGGGDAIDAAKKEAEQFGIVITKDMAAGSEAFNDNITRLQVASSALGMAIAADLAPWLVAVTNQLVEWRKESTGVETASDMLKATLSGLIEFVIQTKGEFQALGAVLEWFGTLGSQIVANAKLSEVGDAFNAMSDRVKNFRDQTQQALETLRALKITPITAKPGGRKPDAPGIPDKETADKRSKELEKMYNKIEHDAKKVWENTRTPAEQLTNQLGKLQDMLAVGAIDWDTYGRAVKAAHEKYDKAWVSMKDVGSTLESGLGGIFDGLIDGTGDAIKAIETLGKSMLKMLANKAISSLIGSLFGDAKDQPAGGGLMGSLMGAIGLKGFAVGGDFTGGAPILVGERGPEIIAPRAAGTVIPNHELGGGSGGNVNIVVENHGGQVEQRKETGADGSTQIRMIFRTMMADEIATNGPVAQMLQGRYALNRSGGRR